MLKTPKPPYEMEKSKSLESNKLAVKLEFPTNDSPADGTSTNRAEAKVTKDGLLLKNYWVRMRIFNSSATFITGEKNIILPTKTNGRAEAFFVDGVAEQGEMTVTVVRRADGSGITDGPSDTEAFVFSQMPDNYQLSLASLTPDGVRVGSENKGRATVTRNGKPLGDGNATIVKFTLPGGTASFDLSDPYIVQPGSDSHTIYVRTHKDGEGRDIADASFSDTTAETVTLTSSLRDDPEIPSQSQPFTFKLEENYQLDLTSLTPLGGVPVTSENKGRVIVTRNGNPLGDGDQLVVKFTLPDNTASFDPDNPYSVQPDSDHQTIYVRTHKNNLGQDVADAFFCDTTAETITLTASLRDYPDSQAKTRDFTFFSVESRTFYLLFSGAYARVIDQDYIEFSDEAPDESCKFISMQHGSKEVALMASNGKYLSPQNTLIDTPLLAQATSQYGFAIDYEDTHKLMIKAVDNDKYANLAIVGGPDNVFSFLAACKDKPDDSCYFTITWLDTDLDTNSLV